jgi:hydrogenase maturation protease
MIKGGDLDVNATGRNLLIVGMGNTLRTDDGIGAFVCQELSCLPLEQTEISFALELNTDWLEICTGFDVVIFVDAAVNGPEEVRFERVRPGASLPSRSSHYLDPETLASLVTELFRTHPVLYTCSVPAYDFNMGEGLSDKGLAKAREAVLILRQWLTEHEYLRGE